MPVARHGAGPRPCSPPAARTRARDAGFGPGEAAALVLARCLAGIMGASCDSGFADLPASRPAVAPRRSRSAGGAQPPGDARDPPSRRLRPLRRLSRSLLAGGPRGCERPSPIRVLGIRSIGTSLARDGGGARDPAARHVPPEGPLRPDRRASAGGPDATAERVGRGLGHRRRRAGPVGLLDRRRRRRAGAGGVPPRRLFLFPSHGGTPGAMASPQHRALWSSARVALSDFEDLWIDGALPGGGLADWVADITGPLLAPIEDMAGGAWRRHRFRDEAAWPAVDRQNERRKYLLTGRNGRFLLRFTGLGSFGRPKPTGHCSWPRPASASRRSAGDMDFWSSAGATISSRSPRPGSIAPPCSDASGPIWRSGLAPSRRRRGTEPRSTPFSRWRASIRPRPWARVPPGISTPGPSPSHGSPGSRVRWRSTGSSPRQNGCAARMASSSRPMPSTIAAATTSSAARTSRGTSPEPRPNTRSPRPRSRSCAAPSSRRGAAPAIPNSSPFCGSPTRPSASAHLAMARDREAGAEADRLSTALSVQRTALAAALACPP